MSQLASIPAITKSKEDGESDPPPAPAHFPVACSLRDTHRRRGGHCRLLTQSNPSEQTRDVGWRRGASNPRWTNWSRVYFPMSTTCVRGNSCPMLTQNTNTLLFAAHEGEKPLITWYTRQPL